MIPTDIKRSNSISPVGISWYWVRTPNSIIRPHMKLSSGQTDAPFWTIHAVETGLLDREGCLEEPIFCLAPQWLEDEFSFGMAYFSQAAPERVAPQEGLPIARAVSEPDVPCPKRWLSVARDKVIWPTLPYHHDYIWLAWKLKIDLKFLVERRLVFWKKCDAFGDSSRRRTFFKTIVP